MMLSIPFAIIKQCFLAQFVILVSIFGESGAIAFGETWQSRDGKFKREATFVKMDGDNVVLEFSDSSVRPVPIGKLDETSQQQARDLESSRLATLRARPQVLVGGRTAIEWIERIRVSTDVTEIATAASAKTWLALAHTCGEEEIDALTAIMSDYARMSEKARARNLNRLHSAIAVLSHLGPAAKHGESEILRCYLTIERSRRVKNTYAGQSSGALFALADIGASKQTCEQIGKLYSKSNPIEYDHKGYIAVLLSSSWEESGETLTRILKEEIARGPTSGVARAARMIAQQRPQTMDDGLKAMIIGMLKDRQNRDYSYSMCPVALELIRSLGPVAASIAELVMQIEEESLAQRLAIIAHMGPAARPALEPYTNLLNDSDGSVRAAAFDAFAAVVPAMLRNEPPDAKSSLPWFASDLTLLRLAKFSVEELNHGAQLLRYGISVREINDASDIPIIEASMDTELNRDIAVEALRTLRDGPLTPATLRTTGPLFSDLFIAVLESMESLESLEISQISPSMVSPIGQRALSQMKCSVRVNRGTLADFLSQSSEQSGMFSSTPSPRLPPGMNVEPAQP